MALRTARLRPGGRPDRRRVWQTGGFAGLVLPIALGITLGSALGGCSPVETWRSLRGVNQNDPDPQTAPFTHNLAEGEAAPYPNLASVPPPPTRTTSTAERQKLTQSLIADRSATAADAGATALPAAATAAARPAIPATSPSSDVAIPVAAPSPSPAASGPAGPPAGAPAQAKTAANSAQSGRRRADEPAEPGPLDSSLEMPEVRSVPEPEAMRPPPPPPALAAVSPPAVAAEPALAAIASATPQPAPPVPEMAPVAPPPAAAKTGKTEPRRTPAATTVATLEGPGAAAEPNTEERAQIQRVAALYQDKRGTVRVIGYAAGPAPGGEPLAGYHAALDRAQAVAKALADSGIPADKIQTEATPARGAREAGRVEIQFAQ